MNNDILKVIAIILFGSLIVYIDGKIKKRNLARDATWLCAKCEKPISPWSKRIFFGNGAFSGYSAKVCDECFRRNRIKNILVYGFIFVSFVLVGWLAL